MENGFRDKLCYMLSMHFTKKMERKGDTYSCNGKFYLFHTNTWLGSSLVDTFKIGIGEIIVFKEK